MARRKDKKERQYARHNRKNMPKAEVILWECLRRKQMEGFAFRRQHPVKPFIADFACIEAKLIIELDGDTHFEPDAEKYDADRTKFLQAQGWTVMRFLNEDVYENLDGVLHDITNQLRGVN